MRPRPKSMNLRQVATVPTSSDVTTAWHAHLQLYCYASSSADREITFFWGGGGHIHLTNVGQFSAGYYRCSRTFVPGTYFNFVFYLPDVFLQHLFEYFRGA